MKDKIVALIDKEVPSGYREDLKKLIRPTIRLRTKKCEEGTIPLGCSKIGGFPDLPSGLEWPFSAEDKQHYRFVAQFNMTEVVLFDEDGLLPKTGMLYFFVGYSNLGKAIYSGLTLNELVRTEAPETLRPKKKSLFQKIFKDPKQVYDECQVEFFKEYSLPAPTSIYGDILELEKKEQVDKEDDPFPEALIEGLSDIVYFEYPKANHHILGYAHTIQDGYIERDIQSSSQKSDVKYTKEELTALTEWRLLFQLDSDDNVGMMWGDAGNFYFLIRREALQRCDFSDVRAIMDCY